MLPPAKLLTIAGSDSGGAAGLQADLKTWTALGVYGMNVVTAVTAQNSVTVEAVHWLPADFVTAQLDAVLADYGADGVKTGFLGRQEIIVAVARALRRARPRHVVIDPVLVDHRGQAMFPAEVTLAYSAQLLPLADLLTPNVQEAALLLDVPLPAPVTIAWATAAVAQIQSLGPRRVLLKGVRAGADMIDLFHDGRQTLTLHAPFVATANTHGSGDTLSAAICAFLAQGEEPERAVAQARRFTQEAISRAAGWQLGHGHGPLAHF